MKATLKKIDLINSLIESVNECDNVPTTYNGGTFPHYVVIKSIRVNNQFVTIESDINTYSFIDKKERYNINKVSIMGDEFCNKHLNHTLNIILKSFNKTLNK